MPNETSQREALRQLYTAEYTALMTRSNYFVTFQVSFWSLMAVYIGLAVRWIDQDKMSLLQAVSNLSSNPIERMFAVWGNLLVLGLMLKGSAQFVVEQYRIILYIERELAEKIADLGFP